MINVTLVSPVNQVTFNNIFALICFIIQDEKSLGKKIIFSDNIEDLGKPNTAIKKQKSLFDDDDDNVDDDDEHESSNLPENNEFRIRENVNPKVR